jgi:bifunctional oligoribonuclease and PAP phosphatase NrnA
MINESVATASTPVRQIRDEIMRRQRFLLTSHARPDGDSIGSQLAMAFALQALGKQVRIVNADPAPEHYQEFPGMDRIEISAATSADVDAVIVMECSDLTRTGVTGLEDQFLINIDHHAGNRMYGAINWHDESAAACGEMVFDVIRELGVPLTLEIATHIYLAILTDTGSFHHSNITPRTFDICRQCMEAGISPPAIARSIFDSNNLGRLKLFGAVLSRMELDPTGRIALISVDQQLADNCGGTYEDTEGINNLPLTVKEIVAVAFFKEAEDGQWRVSLRSKEDVDVNAVAKALGGGGHRNASGCTVHGTLPELKALLTAKLTEAIDASTSYRLPATS